MLSPSFPAKVARSAASGVSVWAEPVFSHHEPPGQSFFRAYVWAYDYKIIGFQYLFTGLVFMAFSGLLVMAGSSLMAIFAGIYFWFPKMFGRMMDPTLGYWHFWLFLVFFNLTFFPMHSLGLGGMMRRIAEPTLYEHLRNLQPINKFVTVSAFGLGASTFLFVWNFFHSLFHGKRAPANPWQANTLEWTLPSPVTLHGNFEHAPRVYHGPHEYSVPGLRQDFVPQNQSYQSLSSTV